jgi:hypothetical protein
LGNYLSTCHWGCATFGKNQGMRRMVFGGKPRFFCGEIMTSLEKYYAQVVDLLDQFDPKKLIVTG